MLASVSAEGTLVYREGRRGALCMVADHVHHNEAGGWMMADVWYAGLLQYLQ